MKILFIEDDQIIAHIVVKALEESNYTVSHLTCGDIGLKFALDRIYDLAIIDIMLPGLDGLSIIREIRKHNINISIIILSAKRSVNDRIAGLNIGSDDCTPSAPSGPNSPIA